jgi:RNA polymerase sigma-70 factor (ECF subfamily)
MHSMSDPRTNQEWLHDLNTSGEKQAAAITDLRDLLLRATLYFFNRNLGDFGGMNRDEILQCAEDCAQEALIAILNHLSDFRGDSKFSTWAYKFAINMALMTARRQRWKGKSLDQLAVSNGRFFEWALQEESSTSMPDRSAIQREISDLIQEVIENELTDRQRQVLILVVFHEVPMDEVVQKLGTNRNAIYKMLHDARRKLKMSLKARGFDVDELLTLFDKPA